MVIVILLSGKCEAMKYEAMWRRAENATFDRVSTRNDTAEAAFKARFGDIDIDIVSVNVNVNVKPGFDHYDDPLVNVKIIYDGEVEQLIVPDKVPDMMSVGSEIVDKVWRDAPDSPGYPFVHFIAKSDIGQRDPTTV